MAKKSRRARQTGKGVPVNGGKQPVRINHPVKPLAAKTAPKPVNFSEEYHYVIEDLRRIALIALGLLILLIVLALIIG